MPAVLDHVTISTPDFERALCFYDAALGALGLVRLDELVDEEEDGSPVEAAAWGAPGGQAVLWLTVGEPTTGAHVRLLAHARVEVETFYTSAIEHGGSAHSAPRRWTPYRRGEFNAIVGDPGGNLIEAVAPE
jgi:catechol 2,3-dioxygenase-like lactoylglutathione lyase family enzyme